MHRWTSVLQGLLDQNDLELRLCAGEALAILVELCELGEDSEESYSSEDEGSDDSFGSSKTNMRELIDKLRELSVESHKYRAKKDRRTQHHNFRDYLHAVEVG